MYEIYQQTNGAIVFVDKNWFLGPGKETISGILFGLVFCLGEKYRRLYMRHNKCTKECEIF